MADVVVCVPREIWLEWIAEGDAAGETETGEEWGYYLKGNPPKNIQPGDRVYVVSHGRLRGYAPLVRIGRSGDSYAFCRRGGAVAVTVPDLIIGSTNPKARPGFRGYRYRWWDRSAEVPFPRWQLDGVELPCTGWCRPRAVGTYFAQPGPPPSPGPRSAFIGVAEGSPKIRPLCRACALRTCRARRDDNQPLSGTSLALLVEAGEPITPQETTP